MRGHVKEKATRYNRAAAGDQNDTHISIQNDTILYKSKTAIADGFTFIKDFLFLQRKNLPLIMLENVFLIKLLLDI
ncbi:hypothetical protein BA768_04860 [Chryseobacterium sp. CBo1]|uniref:hypothetical protein n=1 Tax=Chryseobacterium sp. CBo1 TaxID=1869230 RepID=UPI0008106318|nr:hypothetical protein [Chryseobacterium sp. CBo1]OCK50486.1 hypothetical protein BA768_04860 [Chryseobacterium sp. CBo1]